MTDLHLLRLISDAMELAIDSRDRETSDHTSVELVAALNRCARYVAQPALDEAGIDHGDLPLRDIVKRLAAG